MKTRLLNLSFLFLTNFIFAQSAININEQAPEINITDWVLNKPTNTNLDGKYIVLEFWATWCGPCIAAVPHMNDLQAKVKHKDLVFLSITDESVAKIERTIQKIDFKSAVVTDLSQQTQIQFGNGQDGLDAYPLTILIDNEGIIKWIGEPEDLDVVTLEAFVNDKLEPVNHFANMQTKDEKETLGFDFFAMLEDTNQVFYFDLRRIDKGDISSMRIRNEAMILEPVTLKDIYRDVFEKTVESSELVDSNYFKLVYKNTSNDANQLKQIESLILGALNLNRTEKEMVVTKHVVAVKDAGLLKPTLEEMFSFKSDADKSIVFTNFTIGEMVADIGKTMGMVVEYEGENTTKYDFIISNDTEENCIKSLESYGLLVEGQQTKQQVIRLLSND